jgi:hypothetical protein
MIGDIFDVVPRHLRNLRRDVAKLRPELVSPDGTELSRRKFIVGAALATSLAHEYVGMSEANARARWGGGTNIISGVQAITNERLNKTYSTLPAAIYDSSAVAGDTIWIPAGLSAPAHPEVPYSHHTQTDSFGINNATSNGYGNMYIGTEFESVDYLNLVGINTNSATNNRAVFSFPYSLLATDYINGATTMELVSAALFDPSGGGIQAWGDGSLVSLDVGGTAVGYTGISGNTLTGVTGSFAGGMTIPAGQMMIGGPRNEQALLYFANATGAMTLTNLEIWGVATPAGEDSNANPWRSGDSNAGQSIGSATSTDCYYHDYQQGPSVGSSPLASDVSIQFYGDEFYRGGWGSASKTHNMYIGSTQELIYTGNYNHKTNGTHLLKTRARVAFIDYNAIRSENVSFNNPYESSCLDASEGGLYYLIGNQGQQSNYATTAMWQFNAEGGGNGQLQSQNPYQEIYGINNTNVGPPNGTGANYGTSFAAYNLAILGVSNIELPAAATPSGGVLSTRQYYLLTTGVNGSGQETSIPPQIYGNTGASIQCSVLNVGANELAEVLSPLTRTGITHYNVYAAYADPILYTTLSGGQVVQPPQSGNAWFWDSGLTEPVFSETSGGSQPTTYVLFAFTYQYANGESCLVGLKGTEPIGPQLVPATIIGTQNNGTVNAAGGNVAPSVIGLAGFQVDANNVVTVASPPSAAGVIGWNLYAIPFPYSSFASYTNYCPLSDINGLSKQNLSGPIAIGTAWTEPTTGFIQAQRCQMNMMLQNASPIAYGTNWTEPTSGLVNNNPGKNLPAWLRRGAQLNSDGWFVPASSPLSSYTPTAYFDETTAGQPFTASVIAIKGANSPWPFSAAFNAPVVQNSSDSYTIPSIPESNSIVLATFFAGPLGTAPAGWTTIASSNNLLSIYKQFSGPQTNVVVTMNGGTSFNMIVDVIVGGTGLGVDGTPVSGSITSGNKLILPGITTTQSNDILYLQCGTGNDANIIAIDNVTTPAVSNVLLGSPSAVIYNNLSANFYPGGVAGGDGVVRSGSVYPTSYVTLAGNFSFNTYSGSDSTFNAPLWNAVIADPVQSDYDYRLKLGSAAIGYGTNPGSSPEGQSLVPVSQFELFGLPTPGTPIPALTTRPNTGGSYDAGALEYGV